MQAIMSPAADMAMSSDRIARGLIPLLEGNAIGTEQARRVDERNMIAMRDAGLLRLLQPRRFGGRAAGMGEFTRTMAELAKGCASTAWVASVANHAAWIASMFPEEVLEDVWGVDPAAMVCGVFQTLGQANPVDGGIELTGKWPFASGSLHAQWALLGYIDPNLPDADGARVALVPLDQLLIEDTWHVSGLKGTGSNTIVAKGAVVPTVRTMALTPLMQGEVPRRHGADSTFATPTSMLFCTLAAGPMIGLARAMLDLVISKVSTRSIYTTVYGDASEAPTIHIQVGEAANLIEAAEMFADRLSAEADRFAASGAEPTVIDRARVRMDTAAVALHVAKAMELLINVSGASSFAEVNPVQRMQRDFEVMRRHASVATELSKEHYGRVLLGKPGVILIA
jgi:3-hydroxy-9,10-secoandrosta-1,3,5(10)-triene-9,17-dione monooxygenase